MKVEPTTVDAVLPQQPGQDPIDRTTDGGSPAVDLSGGMGSFVGGCAPQLASRIGSVSARTA